MGKEPWTSSVRLFLQPFIKLWYKNKFVSSAVKYEIWFSIENRDILRINKLFSAGKWNDGFISDHWLETRLFAEEIVVPDENYNDPVCTSLSTSV